LADILVGDEIFGRNMYNTSSPMKWTKIWYIDYHRNQSMLDIGYNCLYDHDVASFKRHIYVTHNHLLYKLHESRKKDIMVKAEDVKIGDYLSVYDDTKNMDSNLFYCEILSVEEIVDKPLYPLTVSGDIVVSNVVASSYTKSKENAFKIHSIAKSANFDWFHPLRHRLKEK